MYCYERASAASGASSFSYLREKRPGPITLFKTLYLRNRMSDQQAVFFDEYHLDVKVVWRGYHIASVPVMARGACQTWVLWATPKTLYLNNRTTAGPIGLGLGIQLGHSTDNSCLWVILGVLQHVRTCTPHFYISRTAEPIALIFGM